MSCVQNTYDACISKMKYYQVVNNISSYLYVHHMGFGRMTFVCKKHELMKEQFSHDFHYQIVGWEVCDEGQDQMIINNIYGGSDCVKVFF